MTMAMIELTTVPKARTAMPKTGGSASVFHSKVVRKLPSSLRGDGGAVGEEDRDRGHDRPAAGCRSRGRGRGRPGRRGGWRRGPRASARRRAAGRGEVLSVSVWICPSGSPVCGAGRPCGDGGSWRRCTGRCGPVRGLEAGPDRTLRSGQARDGGADLGDDLVGDRRVADVGDEPSGRRRWRCRSGRTWWRAGCRPCCPCRRRSRT